jgi:hypothetical protein
LAGGPPRGGFGLNPGSGNLGDCPRTDVDAAGPLAEWRPLGFYPVLSHRNSPQENLDGSLSYLSYYDVPD